MATNDYFTIAKQIAKTIPADARIEWNRHLGAAIRQALEGQLGMRIFEELVLKALILARTPKKPPATSETPDPPEIGLGL